MRTIQLYATGAATASAVAQVIIPDKTKIKQVQLMLLVDSITDGASVRVELSKIPSNLIATNGAIDPFASVGVYGNFVTSGLAQQGQNIVIPLDVDCRQGEIIYAHVTVAGTVTYFFNAILHYN